ncbi:dispanin subfamily A member 2b-like [Scyliorhinus canicula]|uniref:dispanin subfamily A member 2b-like n=1 Tax=Scyliorhinus canicula TaxID=7830 RepID=UPI0018F2DF5E|nr:dispanin subfamily A member 2b-like [Scyliorhinus canicula]
MAKNRGSHTSATTTAPSLRDHLLWSLFNLSYMNFCCLGFAALVFSVKARDRRYADDLDGARFFARRARILNIVASVLSIVVFGAFIAMAAAGLFNLSKIDPEQKTFMERGK